MATHKAKYLSKDEAKGFRTNTIYDINTHVAGEKIVVALASTERQSQVEYNSKREFLKDWLVIY